MEQEIGFKHVRDILLHVADAIMSERRYLTELDAECGDGDFGVGMYIGFGNVKKSINQYEGGDIGSLLENAGHAILVSVGGASGPLFGTIFTEAGRTVKGKSRINLQDVAAMFQASLRKVRLLGGAKIGDKTLVDAFEPAVSVINKASKGESTMIDTLKRATQAAKDGAESTKNLVANRGKAKYLGEKTVGHQDAGAVAIYLIFKAILSVCKSIASK